MPLLGLVLIVATAQMPRTAGTLTVEIGQTMLLHSGRKEGAAKPRQRVMVGDILRVNSGRANFVFGANREIWQIAAGAQVKVGVRDLASQSGPKPRRLGRLDKDISDPTAPVRLRLGSSTRGDDFAVTPVGAFRSGPIRLTWANPPWAATATVKVMSAQNSDTLWSAAEFKSASESIEIPTKVTQNSGWVTVRLTFASAEGMTQTTETQVRVLRASDLKDLDRRVAALQVQLSAEPKALAAALAELYASFGLIADMDRELALIYPNPKTASGERGLLLLRAGLRRPAQESLQQAVKDGDSDEEVAAALKTLNP